MCLSFSLFLPASVSLLLISYTHTYAALTDSLGRVLLFDVHSQSVVRVWKGMRDARLSWAEGSGDSALLHLAIYCPRLGVLSFYQAPHGPCVREVAVGLQCQLLTLHLAESGASHRKASCVLVHACCNSNSNSNGTSNRNSSSGPVGLQLTVCVYMYTYTSYTRLSLLYSPTLANLSPLPIYIHYSYYPESGSVPVPMDSRGGTTAGTASTSDSQGKGSPAKGDAGQRGDYMAEAEAEPEAEAEGSRGGNPQLRLPRGMCISLSLSPLSLYLTHTRTNPPSSTVRAAQARCLCT